MSEIAKNVSPNRLPVIKAYWRSRISFSVALGQARAVIHRVKRIREFYNLSVSASAREQAIAESFAGS